MALTSLGADTTLGPELVLVPLSHRAGSGCYCKLGSMPKSHCCSKKTKWQGVWNA